MYFGFVIFFKYIWCLKILLKFANSADPAFIAIASTVKFG